MPSLLLLSGCFVSLSQTTSRIRLVQGECTMAELASCTFKDYAMACIGFVLELLAKLAVLAVVILLCFFLVAICLVIEKEKKNIPA